MKTSKVHQEKFQKTIRNKLLRRIALEKFLKKLLINFGRIVGRDLARNSLKSYRENLWKILQEFSCRIQKLR